MSASIRYRLFLVTAALLYMGPLIAGLAGLGWQMIPVFTLIFLLWLLVMRPAMWPRQAAEWLTPRMIGKVLLWIALQAAVVAFCFGIGRGIGGTMGALADVPTWVPPLMSFMAIPLSRIFWNPAHASPDVVEFLDHATLDLAVQAEADASRLQAQALADGARADCLIWVNRIATLPEGAGDTTILRLLEAAKPQTDAMALLDSLAEPAASHRGNAMLRRAFILLATDTDVAGQLLGRGQLARAFDLAGEDAGRLQLFAERSMAALRQRHMAMMDTPPIQRMRDVAKRHPAAGPALLALTDQMDLLNNA